MNLLLDSEETMIKEMAASFLDEHAPPSLVRLVERSTSKHSPDLWARAADLGWCGMCLPEDVGGQAAPLSWLGLILEEVGRHVAPLPLATSSAAALTIAKFGTPDQTASLADVVSGQRILSYAIQEGDGAWNTDAIATVGRSKGNEIVLSGEKYFVDGLKTASALLIAFRYENDSSLALALVSPKAAGLEITEQINTSKGDQSVVILRDVRVSARDVIGNPSDREASVNYLMALATAFTVSQMAGAARRATEMAVEYSKLRMAFGQPIGAFQALQHLCADMIIAVDGSEMLAREALWRIQEGLPAELEVSQAKAFSNIHCVSTCRSAQQIHGGIGFMLEFDLQLWYRRVVSWALCAGSTYEHRQSVADHLLDEPGAVRLDACHFADRVGGSAKV